MSESGLAIGTFGIGVSPVGAFQGPPYPNPNPAPDSNAIGKFVVNVSPWGTIPPFNFWVTAQSEYANSKTIMSMISSFNDAIDMTENFDNLFDKIWNIDSAEGYGLDVLGRIVGVGRTIPIPGNTSQYLGFNEADDSSFTGFGQGGFYSGGGITNNLVLNDYDFRRLILAKAYGNISDGSIPSLNQILMSLFRGRGTVYAADNQNMSITLTFNFVITPQELAIVELSGVLPIPAGVAVIISIP